jgi:hypothetical protein
MNDCLPGGNNFLYPQWLGSPSKKHWECRAHDERGHGTTFPNNRFSTDP